MKRKDYRKERRKARRRPILKGLIITSLCAVLCVAAYAVHLMQKAESAADEAYESIGRDQSTLREERVEPLTDNVSILFVGVDDSEVRGKGMDSSLSDALLVATLNNEDKSVSLLSIPRDSLVYIPEVGYKDKITHAHAYGGTKASMESVEELLDIPIDYYVEMNFHAFIDVVDALGGIEVDVPYERLEKDENDQYTIQLEPGLQELDGRHALALARTRMLDNDIERGKRQQMILEALADKATDVKSLTKYGDVLDALGKNMKTNMKMNEMMSLAAYLKNGMPEIDPVQLAGTDDMSTGTYYWILDEGSLADVKDNLQVHLGLKTGSTRLTVGSDSDDEYATGGQPE
ncbi:LCP family protein [Bhargavaea ginsengi]|uniref:LCP family protein n=1 Tax=Bhargavaea ginsengi TaxID=426757 RepID=UPI0020401A50|nr:LCP family protein [Bhargavaea ginsengi]MCM3088114.1 LCP family protein [Bhargavaea ginsengi]